MKQDKKVKSGNLRFILPRSIGKTFIAEDVELRDVSDVINESR
jgi:3-dehydroquinate synthetase